LSSFPSQSKVTDLEGALVGIEKIGGFEITVNDFAIVEIGNGFE